MRQKEKKEDRGAKKKLNLKAPHMGGWGVERHGQGEEFRKKKSQLK